MWNAEDGEDEVLAMVCRTGLNSQMGSMVRELVAPSKLPKTKDNFVKVSQTALSMLKETSARLSVCLLSCLSA